VRKEKRRKKTMIENMTKMKWFYSSRNLTSSSRNEDLKEREAKVKEGVL
jgi:hypothetical protein